MKLEYDIPEEVTERQYNALMSRCAWIVAGQVLDGKYFIKLWVTKHREYIKKVIYAN